MAVHDAYARVTPYELLFPAPDFPDERFPSVEAEGAARGTDLTNPAAFATCGAVQGILADLQPRDEPPEHDEARFAQGSAHAHVLYFAFQLWRTERPSDTKRPAVALFSRAALRTLPASEALAPGWEAALRGRSGYLQLPQHMVWAEEQGAERPDSVDGFFWTATGDNVFHAAAITGMHPGRPGYGIVPVPAQPLDSLSEWTATPAREDGDEFATRLPGAEIDGLLGVRTPAEVFKLLAFALKRWTTSARPPAPNSGAAPVEVEPTVPSSSPVPSDLPYVVL